MKIQYVFDSWKPWKNILILGSIHGDEICGSNAIEQLRQDIITGLYWEISGTITCIPYANSSAHRAWVRQIIHNLNRIFWTQETTGEHQMARSIEKHILESDFILDLHSFSSGVDPFVFNDYDTPEINQIIQNIPIPYVMTNWTNLYTESTELDTIGFAKKHWKMGITIECGQNQDIRSSDNAYNYIISILNSLWAIDNNPKKPYEKQIWITVDTIVRKKENGRFSKEWKNFDPIKKNEIIGIYDSINTEIRAPYDGVIIMPNTSVEISWEWCYFWKILTP